MPTLPALAVDGPGTKIYAPLSASSPIASPNLHKTAHPSIPASGWSERSSSPASSASGGSVGSGTLGSHTTANGPAQLDLGANGHGEGESNGYLHPHRGLRSDSEETLGPSGVLGRNGTIRAAGQGSGRGKGKGKAVVDNKGHWTYTHEGEAGDVGAYGAAGAQEGRRVEGSGLGEQVEMDRRKAWDEEQGRVEEVYGTSGQYPPTNEEEEEERRIQDNLARMAARDQARRRAARTSRMYPAGSGPGGNATGAMPPHLDDPDIGTAGGGSGFSSATNYRRPTSAMGLGRSNSKSNRGSFLGMVDGLWKGNGGGAGRGMERLDDGEEELSRETSRQSYNNPYDPHPHPTRQLSSSSSTSASSVPSRVMPQLQPHRASSGNSAAHLNLDARPGHKRTHTLDRNDPAYALSPFADPDDEGQGQYSPPVSVVTGSGGVGESSHGRGKGRNEYERPVSRVFPGFPDYEEDSRARRARELAQAQSTPLPATAPMHPHAHTRTPSQAEQEQGFSYAGAGWRGGAGSDGYSQQRQPVQGGPTTARPRERWWHSLCAWGNDLDGGHGQDPDGQVGRTNPYE